MTWRPVKLQMSALTDKMLDVHVLNWNLLQLACLQPSCSAQPSQWPWADKQTLASDEQVGNWID